MESTLIKFVCSGMFEDKEKKKIESLVIELRKTKFWLLSFLLYNNNINYIFIIIY